MNTQEMIAIKAQYQNDIRRFALPATSTFATLQTSINNLFNLSGPVIKFTDDEGDLCSITCQPELDTALELNKGKVLRLQLFKRVVEVPQIPQSVVPPTACAQQFNKDQIKNFWHEKMENKKSCLVAKHERITAKLADESLPAERRFLTSKLEQIQARISFLEAKQQQMSQCPQENWKGRGCFGKAQRETASTEPKCGEQHKKLWIEKMEKRKAFLVAKRDQINAKLADESLPAERRRFLTEKLEKVNERISFFDAKQQQLSQCPQENWKGRGERRHGPCARRGEHRDAEHQGPRCGENGPHKKFWLEKMEDRKAWLIAKRDQINAKLADESLPAEKRRCLTEKLEKVNARIAFFEGKQEKISQHPHGERRHGPCGRGGRVHVVVLEQHAAAERPCGGKAQRWGEWMEKKQGMLAAKKESINGKLASTEITPERRNALNAKLERIEERLKAIEARKQQMNDHQNGDAGEHCRRGGRGQGHREHPRCGRGGKRFELIKLQ